MTGLNKLDDREWRNLEKIIMFGCGRQGNRVFWELKKDFEIVAVVDNSVKKQGRLSENYPHGYS